MSSRVRVPLTGRSNRSDASHRESLGSARDSVRPSTSSSRLSISSDEKAMWNDSLRIYRPFSPRDPFVPEAKVMPPILPKSPFPTVPPPELPPRPKRPLACPTSWIEEAQKPDLFDRSNFAGRLDEESKVKHCREFIERNQNELWKYDTEYMKKTPRSLCRQIVRDRNFVGIMTKNYSRERVLKLSNSDSTKDCLTFDDDPNDRFGGNATAYSDPFITSLTTSRRSRDQKLETLFIPAAASAEKKFNRGHEHAPEYGNFSRYNSVIKTNQAAVLKR